MVKPPKKVNAVYTDLRQRILAGEWPTGAKLPKEKELARQFGCSLGTVSKAVGLLVYEGLVKRRARAGTTVTCGGKTSAPARGLDAYAFIYPSEQHEGIWRTVKGFQNAARDAGRRVVMLTTGLDYEKETEYLFKLSKFDVRGTVIYPIVPTPQDLVRFSKLLVSNKFPIVLAEVNLPGLGCSSVGVDGFHAGYTMTRHLINRGAKTIGFFSNFAWAPFMRDRYRGYRWALEEAGLEVPPKGVYLDNTMTPNFQDPLAEPTAMARNFLQSAGKLEAVVCADDFLARGCLAAARSLGRQVPRDMLVTGIDDYMAADGDEVPLTTYRIPFEEMGRRCFLTLDRDVQSERPTPSEFLVRGEIVVRESA